MISFNAQKSCRCLWDFDECKAAASSTHCSPLPTSCDGTVAVLPLEGLGDTKTSLTGVKVSDERIAPKFLSQFLSPKPIFQEWILEGGACDMILCEAARFCKPFCYDDLLPLLKENYDWLPKIPTLERYVRFLCEKGRLIRVGNGVYMLK